MKKHIYRTQRRHGAWAAGAELHLTEIEAIQLENEAPGLLERLGEAPTEPQPTKPAPRAKDEA